MSWYRDRNLMGLSLAYLLANVGWGMAWPYLPVYMEMIGGSIIFITFLSITFNLFGGISQYPWGKISDSTGHKKIFITMGNFTSGIFFLLIGMTVSPMIILFYRSMQGLFSSMSTPAASALIVEISNNNTGLYFGIFNSFSEFGYTVGSLTGSLVVLFFHNDPRYIFLISTFLFIASAIISQSIIKEKRSKIDRRKIPFPTFRHEGRPGRFPLHIKDAINIWRTNRNVMLASLAVFFTMTASGEVYSILPVYFSNKFSSEWVGFLYGVESISIVIFMPVFGILVDKLKAKYIMAAGIFGYIITFILYSNINSPQLMILAEIISGFKWSAFIVAASTYVARVAPKEKEARAQGILNMAQNMGWVLGPLITIPVILNYGFNFNFYFSFIFVIIGLSISIILKNEK